MHKNKSSIKAEAALSAVDAHISGTEVLDVAHSDQQQREESGTEPLASEPLVMIMFSPPTYSRYES